MIKKLFVVAALFLFNIASAQECKPCGEPTLLNFKFVEWLDIQQPEDSVLYQQFVKLYDISSHISDQLTILFQNSCLKLQRTFETDQSSKMANNYKYRLFGIIVHSSSDYSLRLWMQPACSDELIAETEVRFQMYPFFDVKKIATQAAQQFIKEIFNFVGFQLKQRESKNYGFGGDLLGGNIEITMDNTLDKGEETQVVLKVVDCDKTPLKNKEITTVGTTGGMFTPAKFTTDSEGTAKVKFKMMTDKTAFVKAACETKNVWGCQDLYTGTEVVKGNEKTEKWSGTITFLQTTRSKSATRDGSADLYSEHYLQIENRMQATFTNGEGTGTQTSRMNKKSYIRKSIAPSVTCETEEKQNSTTEGKGSSVLTLSIDEDEKTYSIEATIPASVGIATSTLTSKGSCKGQSSQNMEASEEASVITVEHQKLGDNPNVIEGELREEHPGDENSSLIVIKWSFIRNPERQTLKNLK